MTAEARQVRVELIGPFGLERSSEFDVAARTTWVEWKNLSAGPGEYDVRLTTSEHCTAHDRVIVGGE